MYEIQIKLNMILKDYFNVNIIDPQNTALADSNLLTSVGFRARDLLFFLHTIETQFKIEIPEEDIDEGRFSTFNNIVNIIYNQYQLKGVAS